jgi:hypothetical protein
MDHQSVKYPLPPFLEGLGGCTPQAYARWLARKAKAHAKRDRTRGNKEATVEAYKLAIHQAVEQSGGRDAYTGQPLRWDLISKYDNTDAKTRGRACKKGFGDLPTVDHETDGLGPPRFVICSWRVNDAKNDLDLDEFLVVCRAVLAYREQAGKKLSDLKAASGKVEFETNWVKLEELELGESDFSP